MGHISPQAGFCQCPNFAQFLKICKKKIFISPPTSVIGFSNYPPRHNHLLQAKNDIRYDSLMPLPLEIFGSLHLEFQPNFPLRIRHNVIGHFPNPRVLILFQNENILFHRHLSNLPDICNHELFNLEKLTLFILINNN